MIRPKAIARFWTALLWRGIREQGKWFFLNPLLFGGGIVLFTLVSHAFPYVLTPITQRSLALQSSTFHGVDHSQALALAVVLNQSPYLLCIISSSMATAIVQELIGNEAQRGGLEMLLSSPNTSNEVLFGLLLLSFSLTTINWMTIAVVNLAAAAISLTQVHLALTPLVGRLALLLVFPLPVAFLASLIAIAGTIMVPRLALNRTSSRNTLKFASLAPAVLLLVITNVWPTTASPQLAISAIAIAILGSGFALFLIARRFDVGRLLAT